MKKLINCVLAVLLTAGASLVVAQTNAQGNVSSGTVSSGTVSAASDFPQTTNCDPAGCWGTDGTRYTRGAGNIMFGSNGKTCQFVAPGAPLSCN